MSILPPNKKQKTIDTPSNFFIYGGTMHGKSYLAGEFPNPLFLDTDGNADVNPYPSIKLRNKRGKNGKIVDSVVDQIDQIVTELQTTNHSFETIVIDVIDDVVVMITQYICDKAGVETLGDIGYGKGYAAFDTIFQTMVVELKALPINVVYISRLSTREEDNIVYEEPSLKEKYVNVVNGNSDYMIQAKKIGKNYIRSVKAKRKNYKRENIQDERILAILDTLTGAFERSQRMKKSDQDKLVKRMEESQESALKADEDVVPEETAQKPKTQPKTESKSTPKTPTTKKVKPTLNK